MGPAPVSRAQPIADPHVAAIDAELRALLAGEGMRPVAALVSLGPPALDRLLDVIAGRASVDVPPSAGPGEQQGGQSDAIVAFAERDLDAVLKGVEARGLEEANSIVWGLGCIVDARVVPILLRSFAKGGPLGRSSAVSGLARQRDVRATEALIRALADRSSSVREKAAEALGDVGDPRAAAPLEAALSSGYARREPYFRGLIESSLAKLRVAARANG